MIDPKQETIKNEIYSTFVEFEEGANDSIHQKIISFSYNLSNLSLVEELFSRCSNSDHLLHMCFLLARDILTHRGFLLTDKEMYQHYVFFIDTSLEALSRILSIDFLSQRISQCIAIMFRLLIKFGEDDPFEILSQKLNTEGDPQVLFLIILNEIIQNLETNLPFETVDDFPYHKKSFVRNYFDHFFKVSAALLQNYTELSLEVMKSIFNFSVDWSSCIQLSNGISRDFMKINEIFTQIITENNNLSNTAAFCLDKIIQKINVSHDRSKKAEFSSNLLNFLNILMSATNENNSKNIVQCIFHSIEMCKTRLMNEDSAGIFPQLLEFTNNGVSDSECIVSLCQIWSMIADVAHCDVFLKQKSNGKKKKHSSSDDENDEGESESFDQVLRNSLVSAFGEIFEWLLSLTSENYDYFVSDGSEFIESYKNLWTISTESIDFITNVFSEKCDNLSSFQQISILALLCCSLIKNGPKNMDLAIFAKACGNICHKVMDAIEALSPEEIGESDLTFLCENFSYFSTFMIDNIVKNIASSRSMQSNISNFIFKTYNYKISDRIYHVLLLFYIRSLHTFKEPDNIYNCILCLQNFISNDKTNLNSFMNENEALKEHASGVTTLDVSEYDVDTQIFLLGQYYKTMCRVLSSLDPDCAFPEFLDSIHSLLQDIDEGNSIACITLIQKLYGAIQGATQKSYEIFTSFLIDDEHKQKFISIMQAQQENPQIFQTICSLYSYANEYFYRVIFNKENGIIFVHCIMDILNSIKDMPLSNEKMVSGISLIRNALKYRTSNFYVMRYFNDDLLTQFVDNFFEILAIWPKEEIESDVSWLKLIISALNEIIKLDKMLLNSNDRIQLSLSILQSALLYRSDDYENVWKKAIQALNEIIDFSDGTLGPITPHFVIIIEDIMNDPLLESSMIKEFCLPIMKMRCVAEDDVIKITNVAIESYDEKDRKSVSDLFTNLWQTEPTKEKFGKVFEEFSVSIRRFQVMFSTLPQFIEIFRQTT